MTYPDIEDDSCLQSTITGWHHTIMGGTIDGNKLVISPDNTYRPFPCDAFVNAQEVFAGQIKTEFTAFTFEGNLGSGTQLVPVLQTSVGDDDPFTYDDDFDGEGNHAVLVIPSTEDQIEEIKIEP